MREGRPPGEVVRPIYTSTSGGVEGVTDEQTDKDEEQSGADEPDEATDPLRRRVCRQPTPAEVRQHRLTHVSFRECCPECVAGAAHDHPHRTRPAETREPLVEVHWAFCFPRDADGDQYAVVLVGRDKETRMTVAHVVPMKGADMEWVTEQAARDLLRLGIHGDVILKSDQEPAIVDVLKEISKLPGSRRATIEASPVGDWKSNGEAESKEKLIRVHKLAIETRIKEKLSVRHPLFAWLVEFCADLYNRLQVGSDGKTAQQRLKGTHSNQVMVEFGTAVLFRVCGKVQRSSMGERWFHGIFLGKKGWDGRKHRDEGKRQRCTSARHP